MHTRCSNGRSKYTTENIDADNLIITSQFKRRQILRTQIDLMIWLSIYAQSRKLRDVFCSRPQAILWWTLIRERTHCNLHACNTPNGLRTKNLFWSVPTDAYRSILPLSKFRKSRFFSWMLLSFFWCLMTIVLTGVRADSITCSVLQWIRKWMRSQIWCGEYIIRIIIRKNERNFSAEKAITQSTIVS